MERGTPVILTAEFSFETVAARDGKMYSKWQKKKKNPVNQDSYIQQNYLSQVNGECKMKTFSDRQKQNLLVTNC